MFSLDLQKGNNVCVHVYTHNCASTPSPCDTAGLWTKTIITFYCSFMLNIVVCALWEKLRCGLLPCSSYLVVTKTLVSAASGSIME